MLQQSSLAQRGEEVTVPGAFTAPEFPSLHVVRAEAIGDPQTGDYNTSSLVTEFQRVSVSSGSIQGHGSCPSLPRGTSRHQAAPRAPHGLFAARPERLWQQGRGTNSQQGAEIATGQPHVGVTAAPRTPPAAPRALSPSPATTGASFDLGTQAAASPAACAQARTTAGPELGPHPSPLHHLHPAVS